MSSAAILLIAPLLAGAPPRTDIEWPDRSATAVSRLAPMNADDAAGFASDSVEPGDIVVVARPRPLAGDPLEHVNAESFALTQQVDMAVTEPMSRAYEKAVPSPLRSGVRNILYTLREPTVFVNFLIQLKPGKAAETVGRFAINATLGCAGLFDVAKRKPFHLPRRPNGFADSMGYYGVRPGPFLFLPLIGPTTVRDLLGGAMDRLLLPVAIGGPFRQVRFTAPVGVLGILDRRLSADEQIRDIRTDEDPYARRRAIYLHKRQAEIDGLRQ